MLHKFIKKHTATALMILACTIAAIIVFLLYKFFSRPVNSFFCFEENLFTTLWEMSELTSLCFALVLLMDYILRKWITGRTEHAWYKYVLIHLYRHFTVFVRKAIKF